MSLDHLGGNNSPILRERAESALGFVGTNLKQMSEQDIQWLLHDLQVHQIELQMQNEALRETQLELARSCDLYTDIYDFAPVGYLTLQSDMTIEKANLRASTLFGVERQSLEGQPLSKFVASESQDTLYQHHRAVLESGDKQTCELVLPVTDCAAVFVQLDTTRVHGAAENGRMFRCVISDITERKLAEEQVRQFNDKLQLQVAERTQALRQSEQRFRSIYEHTATGITLNDKDGNFLQCNQAYCQITGYSETELQKLPFAELFHPEDRAHNLELLRRLQSKEIESYEVENRYIHKDGRPVWVHKVVSTLPDEGGDGAYIVVLVTDISLRRQAEEELRRSEVDLSAFFASAPIGLMWVEADGRISRVNQAQLEMLGLASEAVLFHRIDEFDVDGELATVLAELVRGETIRDYRARLRLNDGATVHVLIDAITMMEGGRLLRTDWFIRNINRRIELEREMLEVGERERQQVGRELHDDLGQILHGVHFIACELQSRMREKGLPEGDELKKITRYLDEALATTRSLAHGLQPVPDLPEGLVEALRKHAARVRKLYGVGCRFICPQPIAVADPKVATHLFRIAQEAVNNAIKHAECKQISIQLKSANDRILLGIRDDGHGRIPKGSSRGGIGLRVMQFRATAIDGSLAVQRSPKGGTEVVCTLPFSVANPSDHSNPPFNPIET